MPVNSSKNEVFPACASFFFFIFGTWYEVKSCRKTNRLVSVCHDLHVPCVVCCINLVYAESFVPEPNVAAVVAVFLSVLVHTIHSAAASPPKAPRRTRHQHSKTAEYSKPSGGLRFIASPCPAALPIRTSKEQKQVAKSNSKMLYLAAVCTCVLVLFTPSSFRGTKVPVYYDHDRRARLQTHYA